MIFLATLIALLIERFFHWSQLRKWGWFLTYQNWINAKIKQSHPALILALYVLPFTFLIGLISYLLVNILLGAFFLVFATVVLLYCLGPGNLWAQAYQCLNDLNKDDPKEVLKCTKDAFGISLPENSQVFHQTFLQALFIAANKRIFSVIFWFAFLGPMGAFLYRAIEMCQTSSTPGVSALAIKSQKLLDWLPVRLFTFIFALTGHFSRVLTRWKQGMKEGIEQNDAVLADCGMAALDVTKDNKITENGSAEKEAMLLIDRTLILALTLLAIMALLLT